MIVCKVVEDDGDVELRVAGDWIRQARYPAMDCCWHMLRQCRRLTQLVRAGISLVGHWWSLCLIYPLCWLMINAATALLSLDYRTAVEPTQNAYGRRTRGSWSEVGCPGSGLAGVLRSFSNFLSCSSSRIACAYERDWDFTSRIGRNLIIEPFARYRGFESEERYRLSPHSESYSAGRDRPVSGM